MGTCASINDQSEHSTIEDVDAVAAADKDSIHVSSISGASERGRDVLEASAVEPIIFFSKQERRIILPSSSSSSIDSSKVLKPSYVIIHSAEDGKSFGPQEINIPVNQIPVIKVMSPQNQEVLVIGGFSQKEIDG